MQKAFENPERPGEHPRRSRIVVLPLIVFAALAALFGYSLRSSDPSKLPSTLIGKPAPRLDLPALPGLLRDAKAVPGLTEQDLAGGGVTVVNFWASWCVPCVQEHPLLTELKRRGGVRLVGINHKDPEPGGLRFLGRYGNPFDAVGVDGNGRAAIEWGVYGMPETFVLDDKGRVVFKHVGPLSADTLANRVLPAIAAARASP